jgi:hypothetical protein
VQSLVSRANSSDPALLRNPAIIGLMPICKLCVMAQGVTARVDLTAAIYTDREGPANTMTYPLAAWSELPTSRQHALRPHQQLACRFFEHQVKPA